ncbi:unnamed protein product (mitochondrion) [Plasmodiophora brassicae]|uniref:Uncharacterized protein n=1 Tax=Plasmodiophora brassicae TaxID=37360 RepID=A0A0G4J021_PLABS|nr:hypothetical protein PBRA_001733 [Plasmodiophora brassicae]SPQ93836.1 unnamed protein product [Plasmodiophora brassicae]
MVRKGKRSASASSSCGPGNQVLLLNLSGMLTQMEYQKTAVDAVRSIKGLRLSIINSVDEFVREIAYRPLMVLVFDAGIAERKETNARRLLRDYVQNGGFAVFCGLCPSFLDTYMYNRLFRDAFCLEWERGGYTRSDHVLSNLGKKMGVDLPVSFNCKASMLANVDPAHRLYTCEERPNDCGAAMRRVGAGFIAYLGDVNNEDATVQILARICEWGVKTIPFLADLEAGQPDLSRPYDGGIHEPAIPDEDDDDDNDDDDEIYYFGSSMAFLAKAMKRSD